MHSSRRRQVQQNNINKEIPITTVNGIATVDLGTLPTGTYKMIPGFKAVVNKKGKTPTVVISKFFAGTTNNAMQFDLNYWYDEDRDGQMEFCFGQEEYGNYWKSFGKYKLINGRAQKYEDFPENISSLMPCNINNDKTIDYCGGILRGNDENHSFDFKVYTNNEQGENKDSQIFESRGTSRICLLYTSDAADDLLCVDLGRRRIIKKKTDKKKKKKRGDIKNTIEIYRSNNKQ